MVIEVTQEHINNAVPRYVSACPVALALKDATGTPYCVTGPECRKETGIDYIPLPPEVHEFVKHFDNGEPVGPFVFEVKLCTP